MQSQKVIKISNLSVFWRLGTLCMLTQPPEIPTCLGEDYPATLSNMSNIATANRHQANAMETEHWMWWCT